MEVRQGNVQSALAFATPQSESSLTESQAAQVYTSRVQGCCLQDNCKACVSTDAFCVSVGGMFNVHVSQLVASIMCMACTLAADGCHAREHAVPKSVELFRGCPAADGHCSNCCNRCPVRRTSNAPATRGMVRQLNAECLPAAVLLMCCCQCAPASTCQVMRQPRGCSPQLPSRTLQQQWTGSWSDNELTPARMYRRPVLVPAAS